MFLSVCVHIVILVIRRESKDYTLVFNDFILAIAFVSMLFMLADAFVL